MTFDELNDAQFDAWLERSLRGLPEPLAPANLAHRAIALARHAPVVSAEISRTLWWVRFSSIAAGILVLLVLCAGAIRLEHLQSTSGSLASLTNLNALWASDSTTSAGTASADTASADSTTGAASSTTNGNANSAASSNADSSSADGSWLSLLDSNGAQGWLLLGGAVAIGAIVILLTVRSLAADETSLVSSDSIFA